MEWIQLIIGSGGLIGVLILSFKLGRVVEKIDNMDITLKNLNDTMIKGFEESRKENSKNFSDMRMDLNELKRNFNGMEVQIGKLETRVEERTLRVIRPEPQGVA